MEEQHKAPETEIIEKLEENESTTQMEADAHIKKMLEIIQELDNGYPKPSKNLSYGTAGFRDKASVLERAFFRVGLVVAIRAKQVGTCGVMITASHNMWEDNGVKIVEPDGSMLVHRWEQLAELIVNHTDISALIQNLGSSTIKQYALGVDLFSQQPIPQISKAQQINEIGTNVLQKFGHVYIGRDTRESSPILATAVIMGIKALGVTYTDFGEITTPQLHWLVANHESNPKAEDYVTNFTDAFRNFCSISGAAKSGYENQLVVDCANGVGFQSFSKFIPKINHIFQPSLINTDTTEFKALNYDCGAEYVQKEVMYPQQFTPHNSLSKACSFDGDADRLIYFTKSKNMQKPIVIDGDKQFALIMMYIKENLKTIEAEVPYVLVNTAYSNGMANKFLESMEINRVCVPTGVKYAHPVVQKYVIGANDEPNGHGTVYVNWDALNLILKDKLENPKFAPTCVKLIAFLQLSNIYVGDAICNLLMIEAILRDKGMSINQFVDLYKDNASQMFKIKVADRSMFKTIWDESRLQQPASLQDFIDQVTSKYPLSRAFVRPSGTEDILRLYVEAKSLSDVDMISNTILTEIDAKYRL